MAGYLLVAGLAAGVAFGEIPDPALAPWSVQLKSGKVLESLYVPSPIQISTEAGTRTFMPSNLVSLEFSSDSQCVATTTHSDQWYGMASPQDLSRLAGDHQLDGIWDQVRSVSFYSSINHEAKPSGSWTVYLHNGTLATIVLEQVSVRIENDGGRFAVPLGLIKNLQCKETDSGVAVVLEILPGGQAIQGYIASPMLRGSDLWGQPLSIPWENLSMLMRLGDEVSKISSLQFEQSVTGQWADGTVMQGTMPISILTIKGRRGNWVLPTTCIRQVRRNPKGSFSVETTVGEWLTGRIKPRKFFGFFNGENSLWPFSSCAMIQWPNPPADLPDSNLSWRLDSGDLLVGAWEEDVQEDLASPSPVPQVRGMVGSSESHKPLRINGQWPVSRFNIRH